MFKLERVQISGFKSFYEKVDLAFPGNVTAVVGPNGCGKSNISDAVSWALGEQSAKTLRGERMDDVIFNGSSKRRPLGMAEVVLTLSTRRSRHDALPEDPGSEDVPITDGNGNGNGNGHDEPADMTSPGVASDTETLRIGRRVYREGVGEYFLNDKQVRLKDIQDRLLGTGLGVRAYSVIEQGRIDQVLSTKPQDRRRLIEEAAGITRYKLKKRLAETKLEETRGNLLRISDIISEIERNVASLKRQASRAARYREHTEALKGKKAALARTRHDVLLAAVAEAGRARDERRDREAEAAAALGRAEAELASARAAAGEIQAERDRLRDAVAALENAIQRDDALLEGNRRAMADLAERRASLEREGRDVSAERFRSVQELTELEERLERAVAEARSRSLAREEADERAAASAAALAALERELDLAREVALSAAGERVAARNLRHEVDLEASRTAASLSRSRESHERLSHELAERAAELGRALEEEGRLSAEAAAARRETQEWEAELERLAGALLEAEAARESAREALSVAEHRLSALNEIWKSRQDNVHSLRGALASAGLTDGGALSDRLHPKPRWEAAVDLLLGDDVDAILSSGDVRAAVEASRGLSSASFVRSDWSAAAGREDGLRGDGWDAVLENPGALTAAERAALPPVIFVEDLRAALREADQRPAVTFVTPDRELVRGSLVRIVRTPPEASGPFALRREIERLESDAARARESTAAFERSVEELRRARHDCETLMPARREREREASARLSAFSGRAEERRSERDRLEKERDVLAAEMETLAGESRRMDEQRGSLEAQERGHAERESAVRLQTDALATKLPEARSFAASAAEELAHRRTEAEVAAERRRALDSAREKLLETAQRSRPALERRVRGRPPAVRSRRGARRRGGYGPRPPVGEPRLAPEERGGAAGGRRGGRRGYGAGRRGRGRDEDAPVDPRRGARDAIRIRGLRNARARRPRPPDRTGA